MALVAVRRPRLATAAAAMLILASASACGGGHAGPAPQPRSAPSASGTPVDLSNVLIQPAGFVAVPNDTTSWAAADAE